MNQSKNQTNNPIKMNFYSVCSRNPGAVVSE